MKNNDFMKNSTTALVLSVIENEDLYGYKIIKELEARSEKMFCLKEGTLYPILHSLEGNGYVECYWVDVDNKKRKYYHITRKGKSFLKDCKQEWTEYSVAVSKVLNYA